MEQLAMNLFDGAPARADAEIFTEVLSRDDLRIERIVSTGQCTPADKPHRQGHDEWVLLLAGSAGLRIEGEGERNLRPGDHILIPAHRAHWVTWTAKDEPTIWLAIHFPSLGLSAAVDQRRCVVGNRTFAPPPRRAARAVQ